MPNPNFLPLIGSSFDQLAGQQQSWAGFNNQVDSANLQRAAQAEQSRNSYLERLAQMQAADAARSDTNQRASAELQFGATRQAITEAEANRRFDIENKQKQDELKVQSKRYEFQTKQKEQDKQDALDSAENYATFKADEVAQAGADKEKAQERYDNALAAHEKAISEASKTLPAGKVKYQPSSNEFVWASPLIAPKPAEVEALQAANEKLGAVGSEFKSASAEYKTHLDNWSQLVKEASTLGLTVGKKNGKHGFLRVADGSFFGSAAKAAAQDTSQDDEETGASMNPISTPSAAIPATGARRVVRGPGGALIFAPEAAASAPSPFNFSNWGGY